MVSKTHNQEAFFIIQSNAFVIMYGSTRCFAPIPFLYELMRYSIKRDADNKYFSEYGKEYMIREAKKQLNID